MLNEVGVEDVTLLFLWNKLINWSSCLLRKLKSHGHHTWSRILEARKSNFRLYDFERECMMLHEYARGSEWWNPLKLKPSWGWCWRARQHDDCRCLMYGKQIVDLLKGANTIHTSDCCARHTLSLRWSITYVSLNYLFNFYIRNIHDSQFNKC